MEIKVDVEIDSPTDKVWKAITDINNCANMISGIISLEILHQPEDCFVDLKWKETREVFGKQSTETMWITDYKDG